MSEREIDLPDRLRRVILDHCVSALPNEGCGLIALEGHRVAQVYPTHNDDESPVSYTIPPREHFDALIDAEGNGWALEGAFHSHPRGPAGMSATDLARALGPGWLYVVVDLSDTEPVFAGWRDGLSFGL